MLHLASVLAVCCVSGAAAQDPRIPQTDRRKIEAMLHQQVSRCWAPPPSPEGARVGVQVVFEMDVSGMLIGKPKASRVSGPGSEGATFFEPGAAAAIRAVERCAPYWLPPKAYVYWRQATINFLDPPPSSAPSEPGSPR